MRGMSGLKLTAALAFAVAMTTSATAGPDWNWATSGASSSASASNASTGGGSFASIFGGGASGSANVSFPKAYSPGQIIVSFGDRRLYHVTARGRARSYPIASPRQKSRWSGVHRITRKQVNPVWTPTPIMRKENPRLPAYVPGGHKKNPLGVRALYLGSTMYRIHGTDAPWTIGKAVSKGCIRMHNSHVVELYKRIRVGTKVTTTYKKFKS